LHDVSLPQHSRPRGHGQHWESRECTIASDKISLQRYVMQQILAFENVFTSGTPSQAVHFLRRLHNFAAQVQPVIVDANRRATQVRLEALGDGLPSPIPSTSRSRTKRSRPSSSTSDEDRASPPPGALQDLAFNYKLVPHGDLGVSSTYVRNLLVSFLPFCSIVGPAEFSESYQREGQI
jgi:hypothetical protein